MFKKHPHNQYLLVRGACFYHEKVRTLDYKGVRTGILCGFEFYRTAIIKFIKSLFNLNDNVETDSPIEGAVDLGLPSRTFWANRNIGANTPEEKGDFFAWGETEPKDFYCTENYKYTCVWDDRLYTKYDDSLLWLRTGVHGYDNKKILDSEDDVAAVKWGANWRMPTKNEIEELAKCCTWIETNLNGIEGYKVIGPNKNFIFFPMTGEKNVHCEKTQDSGVGIWSKSRTDLPFLSYGLSSTQEIDSVPRHIGLTVRAVVNKKND